MTNPSIPSVQATCTASGLRAAESGLRPRWSSEAKTAAAQIVAERSARERFRVHGKLDLVSPIRRVNDSSFVVQSRQFSACLANLA